MWSSYALLYDPQAEHSRLQGPGPGLDGTQLELVRL